MSTAINAYEVEVEEAKLALEKAKADLEAAEAALKARQDEDKPAPKPKAKAEPKPKEDKPQTLKDKVVEAAVNLVKPEEKEVHKVPARPLSEPEKKRFKHDRR